MFITFLWNYKWFAVSEFRPPSARSAHTQPLPQHSLQLSTTPPPPVILYPPSSTPTHRFHRVTEIQLIKSIRLFAPAQRSALMRRMETAVATSDMKLKILNKNTKHLHVNQRSGDRIIWQNSSGLILYTDGWKHTPCTRTDFFLFTFISTA